MTDFPQHELIRRLEALGAVQPSPEATDRALQRVRRALGDGSAVLRLPARRRFSFRQLAAAAAVLLVAASLSTWMWVSSALATRANLATVQAFMKAAATVKCTFVARVQEQQREISGVLYLSHGLWRENRTDQKYAVIDPSNDRALLVNRQRQEAVLQGANVPPVTLYEAVKNLPKSAASTAETTEDRNVVDFAIKVDGRDVIVKADARTGRPLRIQGDVIDEDGDAVECVLDEFDFDETPPDDDKFAMEAPAGFKVEKRGAARLGELVVTPKVGIGDVKFGMSRQDVEKLFGPPDRDLEVNQADSEVLSYALQGFAIAVSKARGVVTINCFGQVVRTAMPGKVRDFSGKTDAGIALGASAADIIQAYGEPSSRQTKNGLTRLRYDELQADFWITSSGKLCLIWLFRP
jgi:hypothetical protein